MRCKSCCGMLISSDMIRKHFVNNFMKIRICVLCNIKYNECIFCGHLRIGEKVRIISFTNHMIKYHKSMFGTIDGTAIADIGWEKIHATHVIDSFPWLLFLVPLSDINNALMSTLINNISSYVKYRSSYNYAQKHPNITYKSYLSPKTGNAISDLISTFTHFDYSCLLCGMYYDSGIPDVKIFFSHMSKCINASL
jgi:hypothetical protein